VSAPVANRRQGELKLGLCAGVAPLLAAALAACAPDPAPRTFYDFMEDGYAREGVLARCNRERDATLSNEECANARRAAAAIALEAERARAPGLQQESEAKLLALRAREARRAAAEREATNAARLAAEAAYEARWSGPAGSRGDLASTAAPTFGTPVGPVMPSMNSALAFDVYAEAAEPLGRPTFEVTVAEPPSNDLVIATPQLEIPELAGIPRPFRPEAAN
jgi:hypothetical protein